MYKMNKINLKVFAILGVICKRYQQSYFYCAKCIVIAIKIDVYVEKTGLFVKDGCLFCDN